MVLAVAILDDPCVAVAEEIAAAADHAAAVHAAAVHAAAAHAAAAHNAAGVGVAAAADADGAAAGASDELRDTPIALVAVAAIADEILVV